MSRRRRADRCGACGPRSSLANCGPTGERGGHEQPDPRRTARTDPRCASGTRWSRSPGPSCSRCSRCSRWPHRTRCPTVGSSRSCGGTPSRRTRRTRCRRSSRTCAGCSAAASSCARGAATPWRSIPTRSTRSGSNASCVRAARSRPAASMRPPCNGSARRSAWFAENRSPSSSIDGSPATRRPGSEEIVLSAHEGLIDSELAMGRHAEVLSTLSELVVLHPLRERFRAQLIIALYRCGRQADALAAYRTARDYLLDELGLDPGPELRALERSVLAQDPALDAPIALASPLPGPAVTPARPDVVRRARTRADGALGAAARRASRLARRTGRGGQVPVGARARPRAGRRPGGLVRRARTRRRRGRGGRSRRRRRRSSRALGQRRPGLHGAGRAGDRALCGTGRRSW